MLWQSNDIDDGTVDLCLDTMLIERSRELISGAVDWAQGDAALNFRTSAGVA